MSTNAAHKEKLKKRFTGSDKLKQESLVHFIVKNNFPLVGQLTPSTEYSIIPTKRTTFVVFSRVSPKTEPKWVMYLANRVRKVAEKKRDHLFHLVDKASANAMHLFELDLFHFDKEKVDKNDFIGVGCRDPVSKRYFKLNDAFKAEALEKFVAFVEDFGQDPQVSPQNYGIKVEILDIDLSEQEIPDIEDDQFGELEEDVDEGHVLTLTGEGLEEVLEDLDSDLLIEFYAPWCGYCKQFRKPYAEVATELAETNKKILVGKMDADIEPIPGTFIVEGFPTVYLVKKDDAKNPILYDGDLTKQSLLQFVEAESSLVLEQGSKDEL